MPSRRLLTNTRLRSNRVGHDFSRAAKSCRMTRAVAPEVHFDFCCDFVSSLRTADAVPLILNNIDASLTSVIAVFRQ